MSHRLASAITRLKFHLSPISIGAGILLVVLLLLGAMHFTRVSTATNFGSDDRARVIEAVGRLMLIPNERPIIATISDAATLTHEQSFYRGAKTGDILIIFPIAKKAVIYSSSRHIIVNSGPFELNSGVLPLKK